ncbi:lytic transglycosylase domain-containing protein [Chryseobacterium sp. SNU WT5]|uniref:lytic transglycosylase domain-containing protein n=1 Tax=Chryseobacterium sp. SNU WT5 TaxID=2594269 RepID=UPI001E586BBE|nr:lytic transglycosylase domain-containing protein [Chryseobacterium sp. SNU WT5]
MMNQVFFKLFILGFVSVLFFNVTVSAQVLAVTDKSEAHANRIRSTINANREIVNYIEYTLVSRGLPRHLRNLSLLESGFANSSVSHAGAVGIWQIMPAHADDHGLSQVDRADVYRSTQAAVNSLTRMYNKYRDWITVLAAYNCGEGNIAKAMAKAGSKNYEDYYLYLPNETTNSIRKYINACYVTGELDDLLRNTRKSPAKSKVKGAQAFRSKAKSVTVEGSVNGSLLKTQINSGYDLGVIAEFLSTTLSNINKWNPDIVSKLKQKSEVTFYLPAEEMALFESNKNKILRLSLLR